MTRTSSCSSTMVRHSVAALLPTEHALTQPNDRPAAVPADERAQKGRRGLVAVCSRRCDGTADEPAATATMTMMMMIGCVLLFYATATSQLFHQTLDDMITVSWKIVLQLHY